MPPRLLLWAAATLAAGCSAARAQDAVVVTAARTPQRVSDTIAEVTVLDARAIENAEGRTLAELLARQPGLQMASNGGLGKNASVFMRGLEARHTLLLVEGVPVGSVTVGTPSLDNLPLPAIDRIEIVRGPLSSLYGSGAMGGVVQVFLKKASAAGPGCSPGAGPAAGGSCGATGDVEVAVGSHETSRLAASATWGAGAFDAAASVQGVRTRGFSATNAREPFGAFDPDRDGFRQSAGSLRVGWRPLADWRVEALVLRSSGRTDFDDGPGGPARSRLLNDVTSLSLHGRVSAGWTTRLAWAESVDTADTLEDPSPYASLGPITSRQRQLTWENRVATPVGSLFALAERLEQHVSRPDEPFERSVRTIDAAALGLSGNAGPHAWQASVRHDRNSQFGGHDTAALGYAFAPTAAWRVGGSGGTSFVAPSFNQLYYPGFGNPLLQPEQGRHAELFAQWHDGAERSARLAWYRHRYRGFITSGQNPVNLPRAAIDGVSLSIEQRWRDVKLQGSIDHTDPRNATQGSADEGHLLPRRAENAARVSLDWEQGPWSMSATGSAFSHRYDDPANAARLGGYATLDLRAERTLRPGLVAAITLNNVLARHYETALGYNQPRREAFASLRWAMR